MVQANPRFGVLVRSHRWVAENRVRLDELEALATIAGSRQSRKLRWVKEHNLPVVSPLKHVIPVPES